MTKTSFELQTSVTAPSGKRNLAVAAAKFRERLKALKRSARSPEFDWYPYDTFSAFPVVASMLGEEGCDLVSLSQSGSLLDIGCGDGDLSFFFESQGFDVTAIENPATNFNRTLGFRALHQALASQVRLECADLDAGFDLGGRTFDLALSLGLLYHLKNPFGFLETLARHARHCLLSTRIAQVTVDGTPIADQPLAYLVAPAETNGDPTNYWIFSDAGLRRLLDRTGWEICDWTTTGAQRQADPARSNRDQRAYCMLRSKLANPWLDVDLAGGWHAMESDSWRWTERVFTVRLARGASAQPSLRFRFKLHHAPVRLHATVDGVRLPECEYTSIGEHVYEQPVPSGTAPRVNVQFELNRPAPADDRRELGVQVVFWSYDEPVPRALRPIVIG